MPTSRFSSQQPSPHTGEGVNTIHDVPRSFPYESPSNQPTTLNHDSPRTPRSAFPLMFPYVPAVQPFTPRLLPTYSPRTSTTTSTYAGQRPRTDSAWAPRAPLLRAHRCSQSSHSYVSGPGPGSSSISQSRFSRDHHTEGLYCESLASPHPFSQAQTPSVTAIAGALGHHHLADAYRNPIRDALQMPPMIDGERDRPPCRQSSLCAPEERVQIRRGHEADRPQQRNDESHHASAGDTLPDAPSLIAARRQTTAFDAFASRRQSQPKPSVPKIDPVQAYRRLEAVARRSNLPFDDHFSHERVSVLCKKDARTRELLRQRRNEHVRVEERDPNFHVIGAALEDVMLYASTSLSIGHVQHDLPIVVVACVEELIKTGIYQHGLFRQLPNRDRHLQLVHVFDKQNGFGAGFNMRGQSMPDVCALLTTFISNLPGPLIDPLLFGPLWEWCVSPSVEWEEAKQQRQREQEEEEDAKLEGSSVTIPPHGHSRSKNGHNGLGRAAPVNRQAKDDEEEDDHNRILLAQCLLRLSPLPNLSLLVYLCAFFTQLPLCPDNGIQFEDVARIFGVKLLGSRGSSTPPGAKNMEAVADGKSELNGKIISQKLMMWLLVRWQRISDGLFSDHEHDGISESLSSPSPTVVPLPSGLHASSSPSSAAIARKEKKNEAPSVLLPQRAVEKRKVPGSGSGAIKSSQARTGSDASSLRPRTIQARSHSQSSSSSSDVGIDDGELDEGELAEEHQRRKKRERGSHPSLSPSSPLCPPLGHFQNPVHVLAPALPALTTTSIRITPKPR